MFVNFCDKCLRTDVTCSTVSTEGYEVTNLVNNSGKGFLAYSCIRPPINIDFVFICNIKLSHVVVWPQVGAQKSSGFKLFVKASDSNDEPFTDVSTGFLQKESGILFHRRDISPHLETIAPPNFAERFIKSWDINNYVSTLRLSILKTDNSVPALAKIEIWGSVSPKCAKDVAMNVTALWMNRFNHLLVNKNSNLVTNDKKQEEKRDKINDNVLNVPEDFLDPITLEIMTQPIILPSGKIIDQKTLEKHGHSEAVWGRPVTDPFTAIPFSDVNRPIAAAPLKARIDKFLLENSNQAEIRMLPRVLGSKIIQSVKTIEVIKCVNKNSVNNVNTLKNSGNQLKRTLLNEESSSDSKRTFHGHLLPVISLRHSNATRSVAKTSKSSTYITGTTSKEEIQKRNAAIEEKLNSKIQVTNTLTCECCLENIFYKLPCEHVICRKALLSLDKSQCTICKLEYKTSDPQRFHT